MPTLRQITCAIELGPGNTRLKEYGHRVSDGAVETYIVAPEVSDLPFHVRITSEGYIAPGLSAYVFMDGQYQCNRNRLRLRFPGDGVSSSEYEIDFKLRQKEEKTSDGTFIARDWFFTPLNTGNADKAPNMKSSKNFNDNVGTIEVIILRCKDGGGQEPCIDPAQTTVSRNPLPAVRTPSRRIPSERGAPSVKSRAPSSTGPSIGGMMGGMMGMFDGAGDNPGPGYYRQYRPKNIVGQEHLPGHNWDPASGQYRYFDDQDPFINPRGQANGRETPFAANRYQPQTYTVGGSFSYQDSEPEHRPGGQKSFVPQSSPGYDFTARRRATPKRPGPPAPSTYDFTRRRKVEPVQTDARPQHSPEEPEAPKPPKQPVQPVQPGSGFAFVEDASQQMETLIDRFRVEASKYIALREDADKYKDRPEIWKNIIRASHRKYGEAIGVMNTLSRLYQVVKEAMDGMDKVAWRRASDLLYEKDLYPMPAFSISPPPELEALGERQAPPSAAGSKATSGWNEVGKGVVENNRSVASWGNSIEKKSDAGKSTKQGSKASAAGIGGDGWGNEDDDKKSDKQGDGWNNSKADKPSSDWGNGNQPKSQANGGAWEADDNKGDKKSQAGSGWGSNAGKSKHQDRRSRAGSRPDAPNDGAGSEAYTYGDPQPKPVIKPYWSEWTQKQPMDKPKVQPREVYEYPAPPPPALPKGKTGIEQAVHAGRGANYAHKLHRPEYLDTMDKPYAIFTFKYRTRKALEKILNHKIDDGEVEVAKKEAKKHMLLRMAKDELVEELMKKTSVAARSKAQSRAADDSGKHRGAAEGAHSNRAGSSPHKQSPVNKGWDDDVKPSDSVSQAPANDWGNAAKSNAAGNGGGWSTHSSKTSGAKKWEQASGGRGKSEGKKDGSKADWANAGWDTEAKSSHSKKKGGWDDSAPKSKATEEHFPNEKLAKKSPW